MNLKKNIKRCEMLIGDFYGRNIISFSTILTPAFSSKWSQISITDLDMNVYVSIEKIYYLFEVVMYNIEKANVIQTEIRANKTVFETHIQKNIVGSERYGNGIAFIREYLKSAYKNFNKVYKGIKKYANKNKYLFPNNIEKFNDEYIQTQSVYLKLLDNEL